MRKNKQAWGVDLRRETATGRGRGRESKNEEANGYGAMEIANENVQKAKKPKKKYGLFVDLA